MEKFQIELVVELIDQELKYCSDNLNRHKRAAAKNQYYPLEFKQRMEELEARIKNLKVIRNIIIYGE